MKSLAAAVLALWLVSPARARAAEPAPPGSPGTAKTAGTPLSWFERFSVKGDFRLRFEGIYAQDKADRNRNRIRGRIGAEADVVESLEVFLQLATGSTDPVSTNQTLDEAYSTKDIRLDLAGFAFEPQGLDSIVVTGGKVKNPFIVPGKTELVWDGDLNPEGLAAQFAFAPAKPAKIELRAAGFWVEERSGDPDTWFAGIQAAGSLDAGKGTLALQVGVSFFHYENLKGMTPLVEADDGFGNSLFSWVDGGGTTRTRYTQAYNLVEGFAVVSFKAGPVKGSVVADLVVNRSADDDALGWLLGAAASFPGKVAVRLNYRELQKDAVVGAFTDSDFIGGGTDGRGFELGAEWEAARHVKFAVTWFENAAPIRNGKRYQRLQVDLELKF